LRLSVINYELIEGLAVIKHFVLPKSISVQRCRLQQSRQWVHVSTNVKGSRG